MRGRELESRYSLAYAPNGERGGHLLLAARALGGRFLVMFALALAMAAAPVQAQSSDATLRSISVEGGSQVSPSVSPGTYTYFVSLPNRSRFSVRATANHNGAAVRINGSFATNVTVGANLDVTRVRITVFAQDRVTRRTYTLYGIKGPVPTHQLTLPSGSRLRSLWLNVDADVTEFPGTPSPGDCGCATRYRAVVQGNVSRVTVFAEPQSGYLARVFYDGQDTSYGIPILTGRLQRGRNELFVHDAAGKIYRMLVVRAEGPPPVLEALSVHLDGVRLRYDRALLPDGTGDGPGPQSPPGSAFEVTVGGVEVEVMHTDIWQNILELTLASAVTPPAEVRVSYTVPSTNPVQSSRLTHAAAFSNRRAHHTASKVSVADVTVREAPGATADFVVTMSSVATTSITVDYATSDGTAREGNDYRARSGTLTFSRGESRKTVRVPIIDDSVEDDRETFTLTLSNLSGGYAYLFDPSATGTIRNTETSGLSVADAQAAEGAGAPLDFVVTMSPAATTSITVDYATSDGTATEGNDYTATSGTLRFPPGDTTRTVRVPVIDDSVDDDGETVTLTLSNLSNGSTFLADPAATGTIIDDDDPPPSPLTAEFLELSASHDGEAAFNFELKFSEEIPGLRYAALRDSAFAVSNGEVTNVRQIETDKNRRWEITVEPSGNREVAIELLATTDCAAAGSICAEDGRKLGGAGPATVPGSAVTPALSVSDASASEGDAVEFTVSLSPASSQQVTVEYATSSGTATSGTDFAAATGTLTFPANETSQTVSVTSADDSDDEQDETFTLTLSSPTNADLADVAATGTIIDDDGPPPSPLTAEFLDLPASHDGETAFTFELKFSEEIPGLRHAALRDSTFTVTHGDVTNVRRIETDKNLRWDIRVEPDGNDDVTIELPATTDCTASGAICTQDGRKLASAWPATVAGPATSTTALTAEFRDFSVTSHDGETAFTFELKFSEEIPGLRHAALRDSTFTVTHGDVTNVRRIEAGKNLRWEITVEPAGSNDVTIELPATTDCSVSVAICAQDGRKLSRAGPATVEGPATSTSPLTAEFLDMPASHDGETAFDFELKFSEEIPELLRHAALRDSTLTVTHGEVTGMRRKVAGKNRRWAVTVEPDGSDDVTIELPATTDCTASGAICTQDGRMFEGAGPATVAGPVITPTLSVSDASASEGDAVEFTVSLSAASGLQVTVDYATSGGTATSGTDFTAESGTLTFAANQTSKTVSVSSTEDSADEQDETFTLTLSSPTNAALGDTTATGTIIDDDDPPPSPLTAEFLDMPASHDGETAFDFELKFSEEIPELLRHAALRDSTLTVTHGEVTGMRRKVAGKNRRWAVTVEPDGSDDVTIELPATTDCTASGAICTQDGRKLSHAGPATVAGPAVTVSPTLNVSNASASEGGAVEFTVSLSPASGQQVTVDYATSGGTATSGTDFTAESGTLTFAANETSKTVSVSSTEDSADEQDETFTLTLSSPANASLGDAAATGTIIDDDDPPPSPLTASFQGMPATHGGTAFTFGLTFSEEFEIGYQTLRDDAFDVTGGEVQKAKRQQQGSDRAWHITVAPDTASDAVTITLPETTDCNDAGAICTADRRMLSNSPSETVDPVSASADAANRDAEDDALALADGVTPDEAAAALFGEGTLSESRLDALDRLGNRNGRYDLGDLLSWTARCRRGEARCGTVSTAPDSGPIISSAALLAAAAAGRRGSSRRPGRRDSGRRGRSAGRGRRRRAGRAGYALAMLLAATMTWACTEGAVGPAALSQAPGFLTVELTAPAAHRDIGVLLELEGPGIEAVRAPGLELYQSSTSGRHQIVVAGSLNAGALVQFQVPDRGQLPLYRVRVLQVTGEDYGLRDAGDYRAVITH